MVSRNMIIVLAVAVVAIIAGAGIYALMQPVPTPQPTEKLKVAILLPGAIDDMGWNQIMYIAGQKVQAADQDNLTITVAEGLGYVGVEPVMRDFVEDGYKLLICWDPSMQSPAKNVARQYNETYFIVAGAWNASNNVVGLSQQMRDGAYLSGIVAASITNTSKVGVVAATSSVPNIVVIAEAFIAGAQRVNPDIEGRVVYCGTWDDVAKGREAAEAIMGWGADVFLVRGSGIDLGAIYAAGAHGGSNETVYVVGDVMDQSMLLPKQIIMSNMYLGDVAVSTLITMYRNGTLQANSANHIYYYGYGLRAGFTDIKMNTALEYKIPANIKAMVADVRKAIMNGSLVVPEIKTPVH